MARSTARSGAKASGVDSTVAMARIGVSGGPGGSLRRAYSARAAPVYWAASALSRHSARAVRVTSTCSGSGR